jgi:hypothetical protein
MYLKGDNLGKTKDMKPFWFDFCFYEWKISVLTIKISKLRRIYLKNYVSTQVNIYAF